METTRKSTRSDWLIPASLVLLSIVPAIGGGTRLAQFAGEANVTPENARFFVAPVPILVHIIAATVYSFVGAFQFSPGIRRKFRGWHRVAGGVLIPSGLLVALSGLWMTLFYPTPPADGVAVYAERLVFGFAMLFSIVLGVDAIRRRKFAEHGNWMIRAYAIGLGAGTQVLTHLPWFIFVDLKPDGTPRAIMMGLGWVINVLVAEWIIRRPLSRQAAHPVPLLATSI
jgi:uncharacterized membrane protein